MSESNHKAPVNVTHTRRFNTDFTEAAVVVCAFVALLLSYGDPDLIDAMIACLTRD